MKTFVITGAGGFIGTVLTRKLAERPDVKIKAVAMQGEDVTALPAGVEICRGDILDFEFLKSVMEEGCGVFHLAGLIDIAGKIKPMRKVNVEGTMNVLKAAIEAGAEKLVYTSSVHVIMPDKSGASMHEPKSFFPKKLVGNYSRSKAEATQKLFDTARAAGLNFTVVYPAGIIGPYDYNVSNTGQVILDYLNGKLSAYLKGAYNFVDVRDAAYGIISAYERGRSGEGYILSGDVITLDEMLDVLNERIGRTDKPVRLPLWFVRLLAPLINLGYKARGKKPIFSQYSFYTLTSNGNFDNGKAKRELGFNPRPASESISDAADWFEAAGFVVPRGAGKKRKRQRVKSGV